MNDLLIGYPPILNVSDVAKILGVSPNTVRKLIKSNSLHAVKIGKRYKITKNKLLYYLGETNEQITIN
ncbi:MAG: helix-turn-helix domain-containing protein [Lachnospiraceae bacterium]|jgi:excisionase family DNA binding protein|nr:helix-turn-helix domain-containing protein [Lachnospiraceae bacterium]